jgi:hypothetical protein
MRGVADGRSAHLLRLVQAVARALEGAAAVVREREREPHIAGVVALVKQPLRAQAQQESSGCAALVRSAPSQQSSQLAR